jgi:hypothetical protein
MNPILLPWKKINAKGIAERYSRTNIINGNDNFVYCVRHLKLTDNLDLNYYSSFTGKYYKTLKNCMKTTDDLLVGMGCILAKSKEHAERLMILL